MLVARISRLTSHIALKKLFCRLIDIRFQKVLLDPLTQTVASNDFLLTISHLKGHKNKRNDRKLQKFLLAG